MQNRRLGGLLLGLGAATGALFMMLRTSLAQGQQLLCTPSAACASFNSYLTATNIAIGIIAALTSLGFYLIFFERSSRAIIERLELERHRLVEADKQKIIAMMLDDNERKVYDAIREQDGITQHTLVLRTDLSKAAVSQILSTFERKGLVQRERKGKTYTVHFVGAL